ncbi:hypothetical protein [Anaerocellum danielii]|uniref:Uncharacterized protein n=1 Tax=Anaerocellum danielii TaxID=1387557 RepID=A0ABZ0U2H3_9FIRM|nr:hypothetical protein [Caldicellulosiruptor danielii]WPX09664.1 hypothetical protein SOJ16_000897 [Caldicellulosiruptor danielii]
MAHIEVKIKGLRIAVILLLLSLVLVFYNTVRFKKEEIREKLLVSVYDKNGKTHMWEVIPKSNRENLILTNREVMIFGDISNDGKWLAYDDAIGNSPWELFLKNLKNQKVFQLTNDREGEIDIKFLSSNPLKICVSRAGLNSPIPRLWIIDVDKKKAQMINPLNSDMAFEHFAVIDDNHIVAVSYSNKADEERMQKANSSLGVIKYSFYVIDLKRQSYKKVVEVEAGDVESLALVPGSDIVTFGASDICLGSNNEKRDTGIYKLNIKTRKITPILTENILKKLNYTPVRWFAYPVSGYLSYDGKKLWFGGISKEARKMMFGEGIEAYPSAVFEYDLKEKKIRKIFEKKDTFITNINVSYGK